LKPVKTEKNDGEGWDLISTGEKAHINEMLVFYSEWSKMRVEFERLFVGCMFRGCETNKKKQRLEATAKRPRFKRRT